ncbi:MAG: hypothetical protein K2M43_02395 [Mycoplasmoidaceae bacterium]|nr:hypothetical protein [Mycoplasmoidaceae bacterium]
MWPINSNYHQINGKVVFANGDDQAYEYQSAKDLEFVVGVNKNFDNQYADYYAAPYTKLKESQYIYVLDNYVRRYLWGLTGSDTSDYSTVSTSEMVNANIFNINYLISLTDPDYDKGTVTIKFNQELYDYIQTLKRVYEKYNSID